MNTIHLDTQLLTVLEGTVVPLLTAFVTKEHLPTWAKAVINGLLSALAGAITVAIAQGGDIQVYSAILGVVEAFGASVASYFGLWKPTGVTDAIAAHTQRVGFSRAAGAPFFSEVRQTVGELRSDPHWDVVRQQDIADSTPSYRDVAADISILAHDLRFDMELLASLTKRKTAAIATRVEKTLAALEDFVETETALEDFVETEI